jgi:hypothetical protein
MDFLNEFGLYERDQLINQKKNTGYLLGDKQKTLRRELIHSLPWSIMINNSLFLRMSRYEYYRNIDKRSSETNMQDLKMTNFISFDYDNYCDSSLKVNRKVKRRKKIIKPSRCSL